LVDGTLVGVAELIIRNRPLFAARPLNNPVALAGDSVSLQRGDRLLLRRPSRQHSAAAPIPPRPDSRASQFAGDVAGVCTATVAKCGVSQTATPLLPGMIGGETVDRVLYDRIMTATQNPGGPSRQARAMA
jgi:hypothetical protein